MLSPSQIKSRMMQLRPRLSMSPFYLNLVDAWEKSVDAETMSLVTRELGFHRDSPKLAVMHAILSRVLKKNWDYAKVDEMLHPGRRSSRQGQDKISKWFIKGEISADHFAKLIVHPAFADLARPSSEEIRLHGYRSAMKWIFCNVIKYLHFLRTD